MQSVKTQSKNAYTKLKEDETIKRENRINNGRKKKNEIQKCSEQQMQHFSLRCNKINFQTEIVYLSRFIHSIERALEKIKCINFMFYFCCFFLFPLILFVLNYMLNRLQASFISCISHINTNILRRLIQWLTFSHIFSWFCFW